MTACSRGLATMAALLLMSSPPAITASSRRLGTAAFVATSPPPQLDPSPSSASNGARRAHAAALAAHATTPLASFYSALGRPSAVLAPMVAQSDLPYRLLCEHLGGVGLSYTQMIHAANFVVGNGETFRTNHLDVYPAGAVEGVLEGGAGGPSSLVVAESQARALGGLSGDDVGESRRRILAGLGGADGGGPPLVKPTVVQIAGSDASVALEAARMILDLSGTSAALRDGTPRDRLPVCAIDLNLGCPQRIARSGRYGSFLHDEDPDAAYSVLSALRGDLPGEIGVTAKIRLPPTSDDHASGRLGNVAALPQSVDERVRRLVDSGVDLITVHGRTRFENKNTVGPADWDAVRRCAAVAREHSGDPDFPVVSNGGIEFGRDVARCLDETGADGVMVSEAILENPTLFVDGGGTTELTPRRLLDRQLRHASSYLDYATLLPPLPGSLGSKGGSFNVVRSHLFKFLHRYLEEETDLRTRLGDHGVTTIAEARGIVSDLRGRYGGLDDGEMGARGSSRGESSWYRRHRAAADASAGGDGDAPLTVEERKERARARISAMREERERRVAAGAR